ncbi:tetratricopeptide repeat protein 39C-like isoform X2 [Phlebotomus papatasi]|uniref:tetratricopeptide repeat protein 39C-like isoform X2 n=1 Tax=Phlebotomus papatasi TaxID=29031 RepID=UPI0024834212|nr:tetratricopeptide repeat protein 39C-like isoform X2 [Phlebotomus papatasi]
MSEKREEDQDEGDWEYAKRGIALWLNNQPDEAEQHLHKRTDNLQTMIAYTFISCMNAVISFEMEKIERAQQVLQSVEQRCGGAQNGWFHSVKSIFFGSSSDAPKSLAMRLETQIILADTQLCSAILTFLTQDLSGYMKGIWLLKKAWNEYQQTHTELVSLYGRLKARKTTENAVARRPKYGIVQSVSEYLLGNALSARFFERPAPKMPRSKSTGHNLSNTNPISAQNPSKNSCMRTSQSTDFAPSSPLPDIDVATVERLMGAVNFGYGLFQLSISLLPPNILRMISFLGFEGNRNTGRSCLEYSRSTDDIRAPLATLALLWYLTIGTQIFASTELNCRDASRDAAAILTQTEEQYGTSSLHLFFRGRVARMRSEIDTALEYFQRAYRVAAQSEMRLLCLHEVGWCHLIRLEYDNAMEAFHCLGHATQFSKSFFIYLVAICQGSSGKFEDLLILRNELQHHLQAASAKETEIQRFLVGRHSRMPEDVNANGEEDAAFWRYLIYEMLLLWNTLEICTPAVLDDIVNDCAKPQLTIKEPIPGLAKLILGTCHELCGRFPEAIQAYRECIEIRQEITTDFLHIPAFAHVRLALLLMANGGSQERDEARSLLRSAQQFKGYDFECRLSKPKHSS